MIAIIFFNLWLEKYSDKKRGLRRRIVEEEDILDIVADIDDLIADVNERIAEIPTEDLEEIDKWNILLSQLTHSRLHLDHIVEKGHSTAREQKKASIDVIDTIQVI